MTEVAVRTPDPLTPKQLAYIKDTDFVPKAYRGNMPAILAAVATGREYGLGDMQSLRLINVIDGRPELNAEGKLMLARRAGHSITGTVTLEGAKVTGKRADTGDTITVEYTPEDAKTAGLLGKDNWKKHPKAMLWARAVTILCRQLFGDVVPAIADVYENETIAEAEEVEEIAAAVELAPVDVATALEDAGGADAHPEPPATSIDALESVEITESEGDTYTGKTLDQVAAMPGGMKWLRWCAGTVDHPQCPQAAAYLEAIA